MTCLFLPSFVPNEVLVQELSPYDKVLSVISGLTSTRRGVITGARFVRVEMSTATPVPDYLRVSGHCGGLTTVACNACVVVAAQATTTMHRGSNAWKSHVFVIFYVWHRFGMRQVFSTPSLSKRVTSARFPSRRSFPTRSTCQKDMCLYFHQLIPSGRV